jgi:excisionase family DNA binding protein
VSIVRKKIVKMKETGLTQSEIGRKLGISAERVRQIIHRKNIKKEPSSDIDVLMSTGEVARLLNIHTNTVRRWSRNGILKTFRLGPRGDRRFMPRDVQRLFQKST